VLAMQQVLALAFVDEVTNGTLDLCVCVCASVCVCVCAGVYV